MHPLADTGRVIAGRYRLEAPIGRGAMGVVWRARDLLLDRDVAVKEVQIAETLTSEERANAYQRTLREAKTAARLNHPGVVTVYDVAEDQAGRGSSCSWSAHSRWTRCSPPRARCRRAGPPRWAGSCWPRSASRTPPG